MSTLSASDPRLVPASHHGPKARARSRPRPPGRPLGSLLIGAAWLTAALMVLASIMLGPAIIFVIPWLLFGGMSTVTAAHRYAHDDDRVERLGGSP